MECPEAPAVTREILRAARRAGRRYALHGVALADEAEVASAVLEPLVLAARGHDPARGDLGALLRVVAARHAVSYARRVVGRDYQRLAFQTARDAYRDDAEDGLPPHACSDARLPDADAERVSHAALTRRALAAALDAEPSPLAASRLARILEGLAEERPKTSIAADLGISAARLSQILRRVRARLAPLRADLLP